MPSKRRSQRRTAPSHAPRPTSAGIDARLAGWVPYAILSALVVGAVAYFLNREWEIATLWGFSLDDSWIHAVFARNIATGNGYSFNPGEPVSGSTGPLYSLILALLYAVTGEVVWPAKIFGVACQIASTLFIYRAALHLEPGAHLKSLLVGALVGISPSLLWASLSGMEISLYLLFVCWGIERYLAGKDVTATAIWSAGIWVRPDGIFLVALSMLGPRRTLWKRAAFAIAALLPFFAFNWFLGGSIFPQTVGAKAHLGIDLHERTWNLVREWSTIWGLPYRKWDQLEHPAILFPCLLAGSVLLARRRPVIGLYLIGLPLAFSLFRDHSGSHKRYLLYVIPFGMIAAMAGLTWLTQQIEGRRARAAFLGVAAVVLVWQGWIASEKATNHGWNVQNINMMQRLLGLTAAEVTQPGDVIAASDIGAIGYFSNRKIVDLMGLVARARSLPDNLSHYEPKLMIIIVDWFTTDARKDPATGFYAYYDSDSTHKYTALAAVELSHNTICSADQMVAFVRQKPGDPPPPLYFERF
ncbi:MAG TPA: hypothetical protein VLT84_11805 [Acidobacteriota bacterium]|nr:hypothetical protein [Acidobacteriota bacterium]